MKKLSVLGAPKSAFEIPILLHGRGNMKNTTMRVVLLTLCVTMTLSTANATQLLDIDVFSGQGPVLGGGGTIGYEFTLDSETTVSAWALGGGNSNSPAGRMTAKPILYPHNIL